MEKLSHIIQTGEKNLQSLSERLTPLDLVGDQLSTPLNPSIR